MPLCVSVTLWSNPKKNMPIEDDPKIPFPTAEAWRQWLAQNHETHRGLWLQIAKKGTGIPSITYDEALDAALCYGWIDGQRRSLDEAYFLQRFTPRRAASIWSKRNVAKVAQLTESGRMQPAGLAEVEAAQRDGRWQAAYDSPKDMAVPEDLLAALEQNPRAKSLFATLKKAEVFSIAFNLHQAKTPETRARRIATFIAKLERGEVPA